MTSAYEKKYGFYCDLYFPVHNISPQKQDPTVQPKYRNELAEHSGEYNMVNLFEPHEQPAYRRQPDVINAKFYIPHLLKKENMNSPDLEFDNIFLGDYENRPFIETSKKRELPLSTKVVVHIDCSKMYFYVDKKTVVNGAGGHMLLRMHLSPLLEENDEGDQTIEQEEY